MKMLRVAKKLAIAGILCLLLVSPQTLAIASGQYSAESGVCGALPECGYILWCDNCCAFCARACVDISLNICWAGFETCCIILPESE